MNQAQRAIEIFLIEDNPGDVGLLREGFKRTETKINLTIAEDGEEAMGLLQHTLESRYITRPDLIILDLNLPAMNGHEVLKAINANPNFSPIPLIVFTSSQDPEDISRVNEQADAYIVKPSDLGEFLAIASSLEHFWLLTHTPAPLLLAEAG